MHAMTPATHPGRRASLVDFCGGDPSSRWGVDELRGALAAAGYEVSDAGHWNGSDGGVTLVAGLTTDRRVARLLERAGRSPATDREGVVIRVCPARQGAITVVAGTDTRGLMYALLEMCDRLRADGQAALSEVQASDEHPDNRVRGVDRFVMGHLDDEWFYSEAFWRYYFARLARARYNRFTLVTGFDTAYMSPPYPYFVSVDGFPDVRASGVDGSRLARNLGQLRTIGRLAHDHGLDFVFATWQQTPWTRTQEVLVEGLPADEPTLGQYCGLGVRALIDACPEIDVVHFRVNHEAGVGTQDTNEGFWRDCIDGVANASRPVKLDLRAKGLTDGLIHYALAQGLDVAVPTKYWCEHAGLPHHLTQMRAEELDRLYNLNHSRRYSYSDMLRKPRDYDLIYRLWNMGSSCLFLWGDIDYAARFASSCAVGDAAGFQIAAPLSLKGGHELVQKDPWPLHARGDLRHYVWEDERYWAWYVAFGRMGYSRASGANAWARELRLRFGADGGPPMGQVYAAASRILPFITAVHMPVHPLLCYWTELDTGGPLFADHNHHPQRGSVTYLNAEPSDPGLFYRVNEYVANAHAGSVQGKYTPLQVAASLARMAADTRAAVKAADRVAAIVETDEYVASRVDFTMLADLADYHAQKMLAAVALETHGATGDSSQLSAAHEHASEALGHWGTLAAVGGEAFHAPLDFSAGAGYARTGTWSDGTHELEKDVARLVGMLTSEGRVAEPALADAREATDWAVHAEAPTTTPHGANVTVRLRPSSDASAWTHVTMHYRHLNQLDGPFRRAEMTRTADGYSAVIPADVVSAEWDILVYFSALDERGDPMLHPGIGHPAHDAPYLLIETHG